MEFMKVAGSLRSVRYFQEGHDVEREKIQKMLEAARLASRAMNVPWGRGIVAYRDGLSQEDREALRTPFASVEFDLAPVYIFWYFDTQATGLAMGARAYPAVPSGVLQDIAALGPPHGWSRRYVQEVFLPQRLTPGLSEDTDAPRVGPPGVGHSDAAMAMMQAYLCAVDEGLGACLAPFNEEAAARILGAPKTWEALQVLLVGYAAEEPEAGGQPLRAPWDETFFVGNVDTPHPRTEAVSARLREQGLIQDPAPLSWRAAEVRALSRGFRLPGGEPNGEAPA